MRIIFVRHGHPDYAKDCLTPLGVLQASAVAERLMSENISEIFASTMGRATETAQYTADRLTLPIHGLDFMREVRWGASDGASLAYGGHPWQTVAAMIGRGESIRSARWREEETFCHNVVLSHIDRITAGFDAWLSELGYVREGEHYRVVGDNTDRTVALFSHGGASTVVLSHLFGIPFPLLCNAVRPNFTAVTVLKLSDARGALVLPSIELLNDDRHLGRPELAVEFGQ